MRVVVVERLDMICGGEVRRSMNTRRGGRRQRLEVVRRTIDHAIECHVMGTERHTLVIVACHMSRDDSICYLRERYFQRKELQESHIPRLWLHHHSHRRWTINSPAS